MYRSKVESIYIFRQSGILQEIKVNTCCCGRYISALFFVVLYSVHIVSVMKIGAERRGDINFIIKIWADEEIQREFEKSRRNAWTFVKIAQKMTLATIEIFTNVRLK